MGRTTKRILILIITLVIIVAVFWFLLPMFGIAQRFGGNYWIFTLIGSLVLSYIVSGALSKLFR